MVEVGGLNNGAKFSVAENVAKGLLHQMVVELEASGATVTTAAQCVVSTVYGSIRALQLGQLESGGNNCMHKTTACYMTC